MSKPLILIAEDDKDMREELKKRIEESEKYEVVTAIDGKDALSIIEKNTHFWSFGKHKIACIILDHSMPYMTGLEFLYHIHSNGTADSMRHIPVIMCTSYDGDSQLWKKPVEKGYITAFLSKLHITDQLFNLLDQICNLGGSETLKEKTKRNFLV